jgi:hypothetical protein
MPQRKFNPSYMPLSAFRAVGRRVAQHLGVEDTLAFEETAVRMVLSGRILAALPLRVPASWPWEEIAGAVEGLLRDYHTHGKIRRNDPAKTGVHRW